MFSPTAIADARPSQWVFDIQADQPLPWQAGHPLRREQLTNPQGTLLEDSEVLSACAWATARAL